MSFRKLLPNRREAMILAILLHGEKYGREIRNLYEERTKLGLPIGSLYVTLDRMEDPERGGNRRKYYTLSASGLKSLNLLREAMDSTRRREQAVPVN